MAETSPGGISDYAVLSQTRGEENATTPGEKGFATLGAALSGGAAAEGQQSFNQGARMGAQTIDALAQAKQRVVAAQQSEVAAKTLEDPTVQQAMGLSPEVASYLSANARAGVDPEKIAKAGQSFQDIKQRSVLADPNASMQDRLGAALGRSPGEAIPKAVGTAGAYQAPLAVNDQNPNPVTISPQQSAMNEASMNQHQAAADAAPINAAANQTRANKTPQSSGKLQTGYQWDVDTDQGSPTYGQVKNNPDGTPRQVPNPTAGTGEGAYGKLYHENMVGGLSGATAELKNWMDLGKDESVGLSNAKGQHGLLGAVSTDMGRALSTENQQELAKTFKGLGRFVATVENGGRPPQAGTVSAAQEQIESLPTDTVHARVYGLALVRQNLEAQLPRVLSGSASPTIKKEYSDEIANLKNIVPFTPQDVRDWQRSGQANQTIGDYLKVKSGAPAAGGAAKGGPIDMGGGWSVQVH